ncbi:MFS transporter [Arthrobacter sp. MDT1-48-3]
MTTPAAIRLPSPPHPRTRVLTITALGAMLAIMLTTGLTVAIPAIRNEFQVDATVIGWVLSGYTLAFAMFSLTGGALADKFGANRTFATGLGIFAAASVLAACAPGVTIIVAGTFMAGIGAALVLPASLSIIQFTYRGDEKRRHRAISTWAAANAVGAAVGPVICGLLVTSLSWRFLFVVVAALAAVLVVVSARAVASMPRHTHQLDFPGQIVMVLLLGVLAYVAHESARLPLWMIVVGSVAVLVLAVLFVLVERRHSTPMLPMSQLRDVPFSSTALATIIGTGAFFAGIYTVSVSLQDDFGMSAFVSGLALLPLAGGNIIAALLAPRMTSWIGNRGVMIVGSVLLVLALVAFPLLYSSYLSLVGPMITIGVAFGLLVPSTSAAGLARAQTGKAGVASGVTAGGRELGAALAAASLLPLGAPGALWAGAAVGLVALIIVIAGVRKVDQPS